MNFFDDRNHGLIEHTGILEAYAKWFNNKNHTPCMY